MTETPRWQDMPTRPHPWREPAATPPPVWHSPVLIIADQIELLGDGAVTLVAHVFECEE